MFDAVKKECHCGHDKATHYFDIKGSGNCLAVRCECKKFADRRGTEPRKKLHRPDHISSCQCYRCKEWERWILAGPDEPSPPTPKMFGGLF